MWRLVRGSLAALVLAAVALQPLPAAAADSAKMLDDLEASRPDWLHAPDKCPADVMPARETSIDYSTDRCAAAPDQCLRRCQAGNAGDCYTSALILQKIRDNSVSEALFLKACTLGVISGCTNRAAGMDRPEGDACAIRTFQSACDRNDPWACTMIGFHLIRGIGIAKDRGRARQALSKSCRYGDDDPACEYAKRLLKEIGD
jgi:hypothetical protein